MDLKTLSRDPATPPGPADHTGATSAAAASSATRVPTPRRRWVTRLVLPTAIALATLALIGFAMRDTLLPATPVDIARASALVGQHAQPGQGDEAEGPATPGAVVAQAPGWVEPDPYPIFVTALADGIVERVDVLEGDTVEAGQVLVQLIKDDAELALKQARAELARREAVLSAAETDLDEPIALRRAAAVTRAKLAGARAALSRLDADISKESARLSELNAAYERVKDLTEATVSPLDVEAARYRAQSQASVVESTRQRRPELEAMVNVAEAESAAAERDLELKTDLVRKRDEAAAWVAAGKATVAEAELRLRRMTIVSPIDAVVMTRHVSPGTKLVIGTADAHSADIVHLYDPQKLQVRVDVPLADAASVGVGQHAVIVADVLPDTEFTGTVTRVVHLADIAKNTVQFKVAIDNPSPQLKPDMLARVKFFGGTGGNATQASHATVSNTAGQPVLIPRSALIDADTPPYVWWVSPTDQRLERRPVTLGSDRGEAGVIIRAGLNPGDAVVDRPDPSLTAGQRVRARNAAP